MKLELKIVVDRSDGDPQILNCDGLTIEETLLSMGRGINDEDVHAFAVPVQVDKNEVKARLSKDKGSNTLRNRVLVDRCEESKYRDKFIELFGQKKNKFMPRKELFENYRQLAWHRDFNVPLSESMGSLCKREQDKYRSAFNRLLNSCIRLGIVRKSPDCPDCYCYIPRAY